MFTKYTSLKYISKFEVVGITSLTLLKLSFIFLIFNVIFYENTFK